MKANYIDSIEVIRFLNLWVRFNFIAAYSQLNFKIDDFAFKQNSISISFIFNNIQGLLINYHHFVQLFVSLYQTKIFFRNFDQVSLLVSCANCLNMKDIVQAATRRFSSIG